MNIIMKMVLAFAISMSTAYKTSMQKVNVTPEHIVEHCVAVGTHTFKTPDGNLFTIQPNCDNLYVGETYRVVFYTFKTEDRRDDEIVDFDELEIYELSNMR